eukprot:2180956-Prymnesium_polylepis.2
MAAPPCALSLSKHAGRRTPRRWLPHSKKASCPPCLEIPCCCCPLRSCRLEPRQVSSCASRSRLRCPSRYWPHHQMWAAVPTLWAIGFERRKIVWLPWMAGARRHSTTPQRMTGNSTKPADS